MLNEDKVKRSSFEPYSEKSILNNFCFDIIEHSETAYIILDLSNFTCEYLNRAAITNIKKADKLDYSQKTLYQLWDEMADVVVKNLNQVVESGETKMLKEVGITSVSSAPYDSQIYYDLNIKPLKHQGKINYILLSFSDVTDRVKQKMKVADVTERYKAINSAVDDGVLLIDSRGEVLEANETFYQIHGLENAEDVPDSVTISQQSFQLLDYDRNLIPFNDWPYFRALRGERVSGHEYIGVNKQSGIEFYGIFNAVPIYDEDKAVKYVVLSIKDITSVIKAKQKLEKSENLLKLIIDNSRDGIHLLNLKSGKYEFMNPSQSELTGFTTDELMFDLQSAAERLHPGDQAIVNKYLEDVIKGIRPDKPVEYRWKVKNGQYRWFSDNRRLIKDEDGNPNYLVGVSRNIDKRKRLEFEILDKNNQLKSFNQLQENLLYMVAHDLKNPISSLNMLLEIWEKDHSQVTVENFHLVLKQIQKRFEVVTAGLTEILKTEGDISSLKVELVNIDQCIANVLEENSFQLTKCEGKVDYKPTGIQIDYVNSYLHSIINNTISNAIKYRATDRKLEITISVMKKSDFLVVGISDNGIGIDLKSHKNWLFKPFKRFTNTSYGTGVGLYLINNLVRKNGGRIEIDSEPGVGTTVSCYLRAYR